MVRAFSLLTGVPYKATHEWMKARTGRVDGWATYTKELQQGVTFYGQKLIWKPARYVVVAKYVEEHKQGKYIIVLSEHMFAVLQGQVYDITPVDYLRNRRAVFIITTE